MADTKIRDLTEKATGEASDEFIANDVAGGNVDKKIGMDGLRITESQITDLQSYALATNKLSFFAATTSAELAGVISDETGSSLLVFNTSPTLVTPILGTPTSGTLTNCTGLPITGITSSTSAEIATLCSDETGSSLLVFNTSPTFVTPLLGTPTSGVLTNCTGLPLAGILPAAKTEALIIAASDNTTALATGIVFTFYMPYAMTLTDIKASVLTAPTDATLIVDVHDAGTTIMTTDKLDIETGEFHTKDAGDQPVLTDTVLADNAKIEIEIDQIGSTVAGAGLVVYLIGFQT